MDVVFKVPDVATKNMTKNVLQNVYNALSSSGIAPFPITTFTKYANIITSDIQNELETVLPADWIVDISALPAPDKVSFLNTLQAIIADWEIHAINPGATITEAQLQKFFAVLNRT